MKIETGVTPPDDTRRPRGKYNEVYEAIESVAESEWIAIRGLTHEEQRRIRNAVRMRYLVAYTIDARSKVESDGITLYMMRKRRN